MPPLRGWGGVVRAASFPSGVRLFIFSAVSRERRHVGLALVGFVPVEAPASAMAAS